MLASALRQAYDALVILHRPTPLISFLPSVEPSQVAEERASLQGHWDGHAISTCLFI